jgi:hypothetical protein
LHPNPVPTHPNPGVPLHATNPLRCRLPTSSSPSSLTSQWHPSIPLVTGAAAAALLAMAAAKCTSFWAGVFAGGMFAFSPTVWKFSTHFEVFALNNLFVSLLLYLAIKFIVDRDGWIPYAGALACGLGLTNQHTIVLLEAPLILAVIVASRGALLRPRPLAALTLLFCAGLAPYVYLPLAGAAAPRGSWGAVDTWDGFLRHLLRREYGSLQLYTTGSAEDDEAAAREPWYDRCWQRLWSNGAQLLGALHHESLGTAPVLAPLGLCFLLWHASPRRERASARTGRALPAERASISGNCGQVQIPCAPDSQVLVSGGASGGACAGEGIAMLAGGDEGGAAGAGGGGAAAAGVGATMLACLTVYTAVFLPLANLPSTDFFEPILARFWMQPYQQVCLLMAAGAVLHLLPLLSLAPQPPPSLPCPPPPSLPRFCPPSPSPPTPAR